MAKVPPRADQPDEREHRAAERYYWGRQLGLSRWLNWITAGAAGAAILGLIFLLCQVAVMRGQLSEMQAEDRPWVGLSEVIPVKGNALMVAVANGGKSPALRVRTSITGGVLGSSEYALPPPCDRDCIDKDLTMLPGVPIAARVPRLEAPQPGAPDSVWVVVRSDYKDAAGTSHETLVCFIWSPGGNQSECPGLPNFAD